MGIAESRVDGIVAVAPAGRIDTTTAPALEQHLIGLLAAGERRIVVDFAGVDYISSAGLRVFLLAAKKSRAANGKVVLSSLKSHIMEVFDIAGFSSILPIYATRDEACAVLQS